MLYNTFTINTLGNNRMKFFDEILSSKYNIKKLGILFTFTHSAITGISIVTNAQERSSSVGAV
jgi:hypothetical protein